IAAALLFGPAAGSVIVAVDALVISLRVAHGGASAMALRAVFNAASTALAMWLAATAFFALTGTGPLATHPGTIGEVIGPLALFAEIALYAAALRSTTDAVLVADRDGVVSFLNAAAEQLLGLGEREAVGQPAAEVYHAVDTATGARRDGIGRTDGGATRDYI